MIKSKSEIPYSYITIRVTQSRINKGLLAIPVSLIDRFPKGKTRVHVSIGSGKSVPKTFTPYTSSSRECRIGGMRNFYEKFGLKDGDGIVLQILDAHNYQLFPEQLFETSIKQAEEKLDNSTSEKEADLYLNKISKISQTRFEETLWGEFYRISKMKTVERTRKISECREIRTRVSPSIRKLLTEIYKGKCQISGFGFLMKNGNPYFELHHIKPTLGDHLKNVLVVSPNVHAQFTHAIVEEFFDDEDWLRRVKFNKREFKVNHIIDKIPARFEKEVHF